MAKRGDKIVDLERENAELRRQLDESLAQQMATAEVLQVINSSPGDLVPVFNAMLEKAMRLCEAAHGSLYSYDGEMTTPLAARGEPDFVNLVGNRPPFRLQGGPLLDALRGEPVVHVSDVRELEAYRTGGFMPCAKPAAFAAT
jgi:two-component system NtrC family sensor kinase